MHKINFLFLIFFNFSYLIAQDTITLMQYNLLRYDMSASACSPYIEKTNNIKTILKYCRPDILGVNEMYPSNVAAEYIKTNALNVDGVTYYQRTNYTNLAGSDLVNMLYFNSQKFGILSATPTIVQTIYRDINIYRLYYKSANLATTHDTTYLNVIVAHLKASQGYETDRATMTNDLMNFLINTYSVNNFTFQGDFNLYTSSEPGYQNLIAHTNIPWRFYDPINKPGNWNNSSTFASIHTQSTRSASDGCFVGGGLDDRFDFILISGDIKNDTKKIAYIPNSYKAVGQDGNHFNSAVNSGTNNSVPSDVLNALYAVSDHLPVLLKLKITANSADIQDNSISDIAYAGFPNPVKNELYLTVIAENKADFNIQIVSMLGKVLYSENLENNSQENYFTIPFHYAKGIYFLQLTDSKNRKIVKKIVKE
ncbi:MAG: hypothetical protein A2275_13425 [Bacteroidetes bacterium RIFOXYA12_FULL_35_11]|nr:MAG: hypothetical protein A2X01_20370 [Bacteroidetes bacterium GWF2_35_48]OFY81668.1 MAG: hypothetical protein A2275_13425 [Bacteroidetes bacterium RIFOXYA12_FULL_35_11]HBX50242.1 hypothetical protein [Bacteroidales bacterium]